MIYSFVDRDTEYFNGEKWVKIVDYKSGDKVLQYNEDGSATLVTPLNYIVEPCDRFYNIKNSEMDLMISSNHSFCYLDKDNLVKNISIEGLKKALETPGEKFNGRLITTFKYDGNVKVSNIDIRILALLFNLSIDYDIEMDLHTINTKYLKKEMIDRLIDLLDKAGYSYMNNTIDNILYFDNPLSYTFLEDNYGSLDVKSKLNYLDEFLKFNSWTCNVNNLKDEQSLDIIAFLLNSVGIYTSIVFGAKKYGISFHNSNYARFKEQPFFRFSTNKLVINSEICYRRNMFCLDVPSGRIVFRRKKKTFITNTRTEDVQD